jgi:hypothetical protein
MEVSVNIPSGNLYNMKKKTTIINKLTKTKKKDIKNHI